MRPSDLNAQYDERPRSDIFAAGGEMGRLMASIDWNKTAIGPVERWPQSLVTAVSICLSSRFPILLWWGPELVMIYNDAYRPILGTSKHPRAMGQAGRQCWPEVWDLIGPMLEGVLKRGEATWSDDQLLLLDRNGYIEECYFTFSYSPIIQESGGVGGVFTAVTETTQRVLGERRLSCLTQLVEMTANAPTAEEACAAAAEALTNHPDIPFCGLYLISDDGKRASLRGHNPSDFVLPVEADLEIDAEGRWPFARVAKTGQLAEVDVGGLLPDACYSHPEECCSYNGLVPRRALLLPVYASDREGVAALFIAGLNPGRALDEAYRGFLQLTARHIGTAIANARMLEQERRNAEALAELDRAKTAFFSNISHEFRTPLTLLLGPLEDLLGDQVTPVGTSARARLEMVRRNALRLLKLVNTLLDFSRIEAGRIQLTYRPVDLSALTTDLAGVFRSAIERVGLRLFVDCPKLSEEAYVDDDMWEKIIFNLLSNALKFTFQGEIAVRLREQGGVACLEVTDTGVGIPEDELPRLFERFHRVRGVKSRTHEGSGIGLSLVKELVRLHGGDIAVESRVDRGSRFAITIPLGKRHLPADKIGPPSASSFPATRAAPFLEEAAQWLPLQPVAGVVNENPSTLEKHLRVLVVDDNADMRHYIYQALDPYWTVQTVADGDAALAAVMQTPPDLILSDVMMPVRDGFGLLRALKSDPRTADIPFIMLSARAGEETSIEGWKAGIDGYLVKPFSTAVLIARVRAALVRRQAERRILFQAHLLDMIAEGVIAIDLSGRILYWNRFAETLLGWNADEVLGTDVMAEVVAAQTQEVGEIVRRVMKGESWSGEVEAHRRDGSMFTASFTVSPVLDTQGRAIGAVGVGTDITARKKMEEDLSRMQRLDSVGLLAGGIAHDFNNILTALFGNISLAKLSARDPAAVASLDDAERAFWRARALTNQLLTFAKGGAPIRQIGQLAPLLREAPHLALIGSNVSWKVTIADGLWQGNFDAGQISQTLNNLLLNAKQAMPNGGLVTISADNVDLRKEEVGDLPSGQYVRIVVSDQGSGIAPEHLPKIFDPYFSTKPTGTGLGLAIAYSIVKKHGGHIEVDSQVGTGSTFCVYLPASLSHNEGETAKSATLHHGAGKVLLMDDEDVVRQVGAALLKGLGYRVELAKEGGEAATMYQKARSGGEPFTHVILDLTVRDGIGGKECLRRLREIDNAARMLVSSGYSNDPVMAEYAKHGFDGVITKPYRLEELSQALHGNPLVPT